MSRPQVDRERAGEGDSGREGATVIEIEIARLDLRYAGVRGRQKRREGQVQGEVAAAGQQVPIVVVREEGRHVVVDGFKRVSAAKRLGQDTVQATELSLIHI